VMSRAVGADERPGLAWSPVSIIVRKCRATLTKRTGTRRSAIEHFFLTGLPCVHRSIQVGWTTPVPLGASTDLFDRTIHRALGAHRRAFTNQAFQRKSICERSTR